MRTRSAGQQTAIVASAQDQGAAQTHGWIRRGDRAAQSGALHRVHKAIAGPFQGACKPLPHHDEPAQIIRRAITGAVSAHCAITESSSHRFGLPTAGASVRSGIPREDSRIPREPAPNAREHDAVPDACAACHVTRDMCVTPRRVNSKPDATREANA
ncbi:MAG: hypothetical protein AMXMBFR59_06900 [Rhodanobacteraceae bacterium]